MPRIYIGTKAYMDANLDLFYDVPGLKSVETREGRAIRALGLTAPVKALDRLEKTLREQDWDCDVPEEENELIEITDSWDRETEGTFIGGAAFMDRVWGFAPGITVLDDRYKITEYDHARLIRVKGSVFNVLDLRAWMEREQDVSPPGAGGFMVTYEPTPK